MISLGPFVLTGSLGYGGMSIVYRGVHRHTGQPAAVKVLTRRLARQERYRRAFRREVRAMARLHHPGIARIWDMGEVGAEAASSSRGTLVEGSPWLAMELARGTPLARSAGLQTWPALATALVDLLEALAHAHARGVVHCDLKPSNIILLDGAAASESSVAVIDFGLTRLFGAVRSADDQAPIESVVGTPNFMAPEQALANGRDQGPWTDLYAVGCLAWQQMTGVAPFERDRAADILRAHCNEEPPEFASEFAVPDAVEPWLRRLLEKSPGARYRRAADALEALVDIAKEASASAEEIVSSVDKPPARDDSSDGVGLRLFGVRRMPLVSRAQERDRLWGAMRRVHASETPGLSILAGPAGLGKSRLAQWLTHRAHELGAATVLHAVHSPQSGPHDGLGAMLRRHFRCEQLTDEQRLARLRSIYSERLGVDGTVAVADTIGMASLLGGGSGNERGFQSMRERHQAILRVLEALGRDRPVLLWLDELHWGRESASFLRFLLTEGEGLPVFVVATLRSDLLAEDPDQAELVERLATLSGVEDLTIGRFSDTEQRDLVNQAISLEAALVERVVGASEGNPLFALQLLGHWIEAGMLAPGEEGFSPAVDEPVVPDDLNTLWELRLRGVCAAVGDIAAEQALITLELAAALGPFVDLNEWGSVCAELGLSASTMLVEELARRGLARSDETGWFFAFSSTQDALGQMAARAGRWGEHHARCAAVLDSLYDRSTRGVALRRSRHLAASGQLRAALGPLIDAEQEIYDAGDYAGSRRCLDRHESYLDRLGITEAEPPRAMNLWRRARLKVATGERHEATVLVETALRLLREADRPDEVASAAVLYGRMLRDDGALDEARTVLDEAVAGYREAGDRYGVANARSSIGYLALMTGDHRRALEHFEAVLPVFTELDHTVMRGRIHLIIGHTLLVVGEADRGAVHVEEALRLTQRAGDRPTEAEALRCLGELARAREDWDEAKRLYAGALDLHELCGTRNVHIVRLDVAMTELAVGRFDEARALLEEAEQGFGEVGYGARFSFVYTALLACAAGQGDREGWEHHLELSRRSLEETSAAHSDIEWAANKAAQLAEHNGWFEAAEAARAIAAAQSEKLD